MIKRDGSDEALKFLLGERLPRPRLGVLFFAKPLAAEGDRNLPPAYLLGGCRFSEGARVSRGDAAPYASNVIP